MNAAGISVRGVRRGDGASMWRLARESGTLDVNSPYAYVLLASEFGSTCAMAELDGVAVGFAVAFRSPTRPDVLFLWQIAVDRPARGLGVAGRLLDGLLELPGCRGVGALETTVTPGNTASRALFTSFAHSCDAELTIRPAHFDTDRFPPGQPHEPEDLLRIEPLVGGPAAPERRRHRRAGRNTTSRRTV